MRGFPPPPSKGQVSIFECKQLSVAAFVLKGQAKSISNGTVKMINYFGQVYFYPQCLESGGRRGSFFFLPRCLQHLCGLSGPFWVGLTRGRAARDWLNAANWWLRLPFGFDGMRFSQSVDSFFPFWESRDAAICRSALPNGPPQNSELAFIALLRAFPMSSILKAA